MANRQNFSKPVARAIVARSCVNGVPTCEYVEGGLRCVCTKGLELNHVQQDAMKSDEAKRANKLAASDGNMLCKPHHDTETKRQAAEFAKVNRQRDAHTGVEDPQKKKIQNRPAKEKKPPYQPAAGVPALARRGFAPAGRSK